MNSIQEWAEFYKGFKIWIYPYHDYNESFQWIHWRNMDDSNYEEEYKNFDWENANGINVVTGMKGVMAIRFPIDEDIRYAKSSLTRVLSTLGLPQCYDWVIEGNTTFSILIDVCSMPMGGIQKKFKDFDLIYQDVFILPPGIDNYKCFFKNGLPRMRPSQIEWNVLSENLQKIGNIPLVFKGKTKEQKNYETRMKYAIGCALAIVVAIVTGIIAVLNSATFVTWVCMYFVTLGAAIGLIYIMSH